MASTATAFFSILAQQESNARNNTSSCDSYEKLETPTLNLQEEEKRADNVPACSEIWFVRGRSTAIVEVRALLCGIKASFITIVCFHRYLLW